MYICVYNIPFGLGLFFLAGKVPPPPKPFDRPSLAVTRAPVSEPAGDKMDSRTDSYYERWIGKWFH